MLQRNATNTTSNAVAENQPTLLAVTFLLFRRKVVTMEKKSETDRLLEDGAWKYDTDVKVQDRAHHK